MQRLQLRFATDANPPLAVAPAIYNFNGEVVVDPEGMLKVMFWRKERIGWSVVPRRVPEARKVVSCKATLLESLWVAELLFLLFHPPPCFLLS